MITLDDDQVEELRREMLVEECMQSIEDHAYDEACECGAMMMWRKYLYGDDADGNRGEWRTEAYCPRCD